ncbi:hypothetical protein KAU55_07485, partial [Candidatus Bathyarchaeota archaeon]|nr:hypothetical protein [Candidatus Bathyarchaeota archaeon]
MISILSVRPEMLTFHPRIIILGLILFIALCPHSMFQPVTVEVPSTRDFPQIQLNQTTNIKVVFLGVPSDYIDESMFLSNVSQNVSQFAHPNNMTWSLNVSVVFHEFTESVMTSLIEKAYLFEGTTYYNITLLDDLLSQLEYLIIPTCGYLIVFMWMPDGGITHSWFYVHEKPDLFLGRI